MATKKSAGSNVVTDEKDAIESFMSKLGIRDSKEVTSSSWKWEIGVPKYFKVLGIPAKREKRAGEVKEPPYLCPVKDLQSGEHKNLICNTMLYNQFASYPADSLIGRCFISIQYNVEGKDWKGFETREVPDPEPRSAD